MSKEISKSLSKMIMCPITMIMNMGMWKIQVTQTIKMEDQGIYMDNINTMETIILPTMIQEDILMMKICTIVTLMDQDHQKRRASLLDPRYLSMGKIQRSENPYLQKVNHMLTSQTLKNLMNKLMTQILLFVSSKHMQGSQLELQMPT